ncbi:MAG: isochorismatase family protein [Acidimicrobiales bacterium]
MQDGHRALIVVDVQNDFCEGGPLAAPGGGDLAKRITAHAESCASDYAVVVATRDWHVEPGHHFAPDGTEPDFQETWPVHCVAGSAGAAFHPDLRLPTDAVVISKGERAASFSGFDGRDPSGRPLEAFLRDRGVTDVDVTGLVTSICVRATVLDAVRCGFGVRVLLPLCRDAAGADTAATTAELARAGVDVVS